MIMKWLDRYKHEVSIDNPVSMMYADVPNIEICIHSYAGYGNGWYLSSRELQICAHNLGTDDFRTAIDEAVGVIRLELSRINEAVNKLLAAFEDQDNVDQ